MVLIITWRLEGAAGGVVSIGRPLGCIYPRSDEGAVDLGSRALPLTEDPSVRVRPGDVSLLWLVEVSPRYWSTETIFSLGTRRRPWELCIGMSVDSGPLLLVMVLLNKKVLKFFKNRSCPFFEILYPKYIVCLSIYFTFKLLYRDQGCQKLGLIAA